MAEEVRNKVKDAQGNERTVHDETRGVGKAFEDWAALGGGAAYPATRLDLVLPETTTFGAGVLVRDATKQFAHLETIWINNKEADARDFEFYDGDPGGAAGTFRKLFTVNALATSQIRLGANLLKGYISTFDLYVDPSGSKANGLEVSVSALVINKELIE